MAVHWLSYDDGADPGERLSPEMRAEIAILAPAAVTNGSITTAKLAALAVTRPKVAAGAIGAVELDSAVVGTAHLVDALITTPKLAATSVTPPKCGTGVVTSVDSANADLAAKLKLVTTAQYNAIGSPDPNTYYMITA